MKHGQSPDRSARQLELPLAAPARLTRRPDATTRAPRPTPPARTARAQHLPAAAPPAPVATYRLDERTRRIGLEGIAAARAVLERSQPADAAPEETRAGPRRAA